MEVQDADGAREERFMEDREWRSKAGALRNLVRTNEVQEKITQSAHDHLSRNERLGSGQLVARMMHG